MSISGATLFIFRSHLPPRPEVVLLHVRPSRGPHNNRCAQGVTRSLTDVVVSGVCLVGGFVSFMLFGVMTTQTYIYYKRFSDDCLKLKALVCKNQTKKMYD
jgi:hypothetical protein